jgi:uncharacterized membrane protein
MTGLLLNVTTSSGLIVIVGVYLAYLYGRNTKEFHWSEYIALLAALTLIVFLKAYLIDIKILYLYLLSAIVGFILEYSLGLAYHKTLNRKLWVYDSHAYSLSGYTSWLTLPMWGIAGVIFWTVGKIVGL